MNEGQGSPTIMSEKPKRDLKILLIVLLSITTLFSIGMAIYFYYQQNSYSNDIEDLQSQVTDLKQKSSIASLPDENDVEEVDTAIDTEETNNDPAVVPSSTEIQLQKLGLTITVPKDWELFGNEEGGIGVVEETYTLVKNSKGNFDDQMVRIIFYDSSTAPTTKQEFAKLASDYDESLDRQIWEVGDNFTWSYFTSVDGVKLKDFSCEGYTCRTGVLTRMLMYGEYDKYLVSVEYTAPFQFGENTENLLNANTTPYGELSEAQDILRSVKRVD